MQAMERASTEVKGFTADQLHLQAWLALPKKARQPKTQRALAAQLEVREETLSRWKDLPGFHEAVCALAVRQVLARMPAILEAQAAMGEQGSLAHAQWLAELAGVWTPRPQKLEHTGSGGGPLRVVFEVVDDRGRPTDA